MESGHDTADIGQQGMRNKSRAGEAYVNLLQQRDSLLSSAILGLLLTFGVFNRISFPAYVLLPSLYLVPHFLRRYNCSSSLHSAA